MKKKKKKISNNKLRYQLLSISNEIIAELERRNYEQSSDCKKRKYFLFFDPIHGFLYHKKNNELTETDFLSIRALLNLEGIEFCLLPGCLELLITHISRIGVNLLNPKNQFRNFGNIDFKQSIREQNRYRKGLKESLITSEYINEFKFRLVQLLTSNNIRLELLDEPDFNVKVKRYYKEILFELNQIRRDKVILHNIYAAQDLSYGVCYSREYGLAPVVTNSISFPMAFERLEKFYRPRISSEALFIKPKVLLFLLGIKNASSKKLNIYLDSIKQALKTLDHEERKDQLNNSSEDSVNEIYFNILENAKHLITSLQSINDQTEKIWELPSNYSSNLDNLSLDKLVERADEKIKEARSFLMSCLEIINDFFKNNLEDNISANYLKNNQNNILKLLTEGNLQSPLIIEKFFYIANGGNMSDYSFNQKGKKISAIVDSFKGFSININTDDNDLNMQVKEFLNEFINAVQSSSLITTSKGEILDSTQSVMKDIKEKNSIKKNTKYLWYGVKEAISTIPSAIKAWDSISDLLGI